MKRFHVHVSVSDLDQYAKWMLDDPLINFAISTQRQPAGVNHLGIQVDSGEELTGMHKQLLEADARMVREQDQACCYARSDKYWVTDPAGIAWETFHTLGNLPVYGEDTPVFDHGTATTPMKASCCAPAQQGVSSSTMTGCCS